MNLRAWLPNGRTLAALGAAALTVLVHAWLALVAVAAVAGAWWMVRLKRHPMGPCWSLSCQAGRNPGSDASQWGRCGRCEKTPGGAGEEPRIGAAWLHPELRRAK